MRTGSKELASNHSSHHGLALTSPFFFFFFAAAAAVASISARISELPRALFLFIVGPLSRRRAAGQTEYNECNSLARRSSRSTLKQARAAWSALCRQAGRQCV